VKTVDKEIIFASTLAFLLMIATIGVPFLTGSTFGQRCEKLTQKTLRSRKDASRAQKKVVTSTLTRRQQATHDEHAHCCGHFGRIFAG